VSYQEHTLLPTQRDSVFVLIREAGLDVAEFKWEKGIGEVYNGAVPVLLHQPTGSRFFFDFHARENIHYATWIPGRETVQDSDRAGEGWAFMLHLVDQ
jgi:hypothetical protein